MLVIMADRRNSGAEKGKKGFWIGPQRHCWAVFLFVLLVFIVFRVNQCIEDITHLQEMIFVDNNKQ